MSKQGPLRPPLDKQKEHNSWWLSSRDGDGRRQPPEVWEWSPQRQQWFNSGQLFGNSMGATPERMSNFVIVGLARTPDTWPACEDMADRTESQPK